jgi:fructokinase
VKTSQFDIISAGEVLVDLISHRKGEHLNEAFLFEKMPGGSASNIAINMARLGNKATLLSAIGNDGFGSFLKKHLQSTGVDTGSLQVVSDKPTSLVVASDKPCSPEFKVYRGADAYISANCFSRQLLQHCRIFHTTLFALSKNPSRKSILELADMAVEQGAQLSLDLNYATQVWSDRHKALHVLDRLLELKPLVKLSEKDASQLFREPLPPHKVIERLLAKGARMVSLTLGKRGSYVADHEQSPLMVPAHEVDKVANIPGAGDAYWAGFLHMYLKGKKIEECADYGTAMAAAKLQTPGPLQPESLELS